MEGNNITVWLAFAAGLLSFLSPCVLPLVPGYVSLISGVSIDRLKDGGDDSKANARRAVILNSIAFNIGLSIVFLGLGAAAGMLGTSITSNPWVRITGGVVIIAFGFQLMGFLKIRALYKDTRMFSQQKPRGMLGSITLGMAFAAGWTPCIGPILGGIIGLAATSGGWKKGLFLSCFYTAGLAVPFLLTGLGINKFLSFYSKFRKHLHKVEVVSGVMLIAIGLLVATNQVTRLNTFFQRVIGIDAGNILNTDNPNPASAPTAGDAGSAKPAPEIEAKKVTGETFQLKDLRGRVVILNFWATWCIPCREEIPELIAMQHDLEGRGLSVVGVVWNDTATIDEIKAYQKEVNLDYTVLLDGNPIADKFGGIPSVPTTFIIDREGRVRKTIIGQAHRSAFEAVIKPLLDEAPATASNK